MFQITKYRPKIDLGPVIPNLAANMQLAIEKGLIVDKGLEVSYNEISDPADVGPIVTDIFMALDMQAEANKQLNNVKNFINAPARPAKSAASAGSAPTAATASSSQP